MSNAKTLTSTYAYGSSGNATGQRTAFTYPSGARITYGHDHQGRVNAISINPVNSNGVGTNTATTLPVLSGLAYSAVGDVAGWTWATPRRMRSATTATAGWRRTRSARNRWPAPTPAACARWSTTTRG